MSLWDGLFRRRQRGEELDEEVQAHLHMAMREHVEQGETAEQARASAAREFGNVSLVKEVTRDMWGWNWLESLLQDARYGLRQLRKNPGFTAVAVLTLALGIGANTAIFSIVDAVLLRPLPYKDPARLVVVWQARPGRFGSSESFDSFRDFEEWRQSSRSFEQIAALTWARAGANLTWRGRPQRVLAIPATQNIFALLGVDAARGRTFAPEDLRAGCTLVLAHRFWQDRLGAAPDIVGGNLALDGTACTVVGVMPEAFDFYPKQTDLWKLIMPDSEFAMKPFDSVVGVFARLKPGVARATAQAELATVHQRVVRQSPPGSWGGQFVPVVYDLQSELTWLAGRNLQRGLLVLFAAVALVLLIACTNVANMILGRAVEREKEMAIRAALGAGRGRLIRQLLSESLLLSTLGTTLGGMVAFVGIRYFHAANPVELPPGNAVTLNLRVLAFTASLAIFSGMLFGLVPAWKASKREIEEVLKQAGRGVVKGAMIQRTRRLLVVAEVSLALVILAVAGLLIESFERLSFVSLGFNPDHLLTAEINLLPSRYPDAPRQVAFYRRLVSQLSELPGVQRAALSSWSPPEYGGGNEALTVEGVPTTRTEMGDVGLQTVSPGFFRVIGAPLLRGREFDSRDRDKSLPVVVVSEALVREYFDRSDPIGKRIKLGGPEQAAKASWLTVVGVVGDMKGTSVFKEMGYVNTPEVYRPLDQVGRVNMKIVLRTSTRPLALEPAVERLASSLDKDLPLSYFRSGQDRVSEALVQPRFRTVLLSVFAGIALLLAAIGIFGVLSQSVGERTHEIGIRMALGAERSEVIKMVLGQALILVLAGIAIGLAGAVALTRFIANLLFGVKPTDPVTFLGVSVILLVVALVASYVPARRATKVDPMVALRYE